jgi:methylenetetrahydrofolate reductase (NADPH)
LEKLLRAGHFVATGELGPPQSADGEVIRRKAQLLEGKCDAVNITDNQTAIVRMSSIGSGVICLQEGVEPIIQMTCRDRNRLAIQSDLLAAHALGIRNLLCLTGDHQSFGNHPTAKNVHDLDSVGAAANPFADPFDFRPHRLAKKVEAGADFIQTQLIYNMDKFAEFMRRVREMGLHERVYILAGIGPLKTPGMARYMRDKVPGMDVPDEFVERMEAAARDIPKEEKKARRAAWRQEGIKITVEQIEQLRQMEGVAGVHIMSIEWEEGVGLITERAGLLPRPAI